MIYKFSNLLAICFLLTSCDDNASHKSKDNKAANIDPLACYSYIKNKDTITLKMVNVNGFITGTLIYNLYEKDKNAGTIQGKMKGDLLIADYSFMSEGVNSIRQVAFKKSKDDFVEGYGEIEERNGKIVFRNSDSLVFNNAIFLKPVNCEK